jgi:hypothetical protein
MKMWKQVQSFDTDRLLLSHFEGSAEARKQWQEKMGWFVPTDLEPNAPLGSIMQVVLCKQYHILIAEVW